MKIRILLLVAFLSAFLTSKAQDQELKQQLFVSVGFLDFSYLENLFDDNFGVSGLPGVGMVEYRLSQNRFGAGVSVFSRYLNGELPWGNKSHRFLGILPHFDFYWVNEKKYQVSSQMAVGYRFGETTTTDQNSAYFVSLYRRPAFQITPLSVSYGTGRWFGRFEVGFGHKGFGTLGLGLQL